MYLVIHVGSEGDVFVMHMDKEELETRLDQYYFGVSAHFLSTVPDSDTSAWPKGSVLIMKGGIVVPALQKATTGYSVVNYGID